MTRLRVTDVVLVDETISSPEMVQHLSACQLSGIQIHTLAEFVEELTGQVPVRHLLPESFIPLFLEWGKDLPLYDAAKRVLDVLGAVVGLTLLALLLIPVAPLILLASPGGLFHSQERVGRSGRRFRIYKLRTMVANAEHDGRAVWAARGDHRVTWIGQFLRSTGIDEFPQFWNVLVGDMSLIGPRPERPELVEEICRVEPLFSHRTLVKPGLSGWAVLNAGYARSINSSRVKLRYDLYYIRHRSFFLDLAILSQTMGLILFMRGGKT